MKLFFKRAGAKIGRFFWSWGFLKFVLWTVTLIILFYVEEDWRGARAWAATKAEWEAKGETFDYNKFIPPPLPDDENLGAIPLFKIETAQDGGMTYPAPAALRKAMRSDLPNFDFPRLGDLSKGELPDRSKIQNVLAIDYAGAFNGTKPPGDTLAQFNAIFPFFTDLLAASAERPLCRFNLDYTIFPPMYRSLGLLTDQIKLSKILTLHAVLALDQQQPDLALEDIKLNYKLLSGVKRDPSLVGGLVAIGMTAINQPALCDGLAQHLWSDAQLVELEQTLEPIDFLADYQFAMRSGAAASVANLDSFKESASRSAFGGFLVQKADDDLPVMISPLPRWPGGWWDNNKSQLAAFFFQKMATVDPRSRLVFPEVHLSLQLQFEKKRARWDAIAPWNCWFCISAPAWDKCTQTFAVAQARIDEARIACALERYRLAHGVYPGALEGLAPAYIDALPHDIMNGEPYHYQLRADGSYLLYSVGWNETDDGGKVVFKKDNPTAVDYNEGDWVWPTPQ